MRSSRTLRKKKRQKILAISVASALVVVAILAVLGVFHRHKYEERVIAPTCQSVGYTEYVCECGESYKANETPAIDHDMQNIPAELPKCLSNGYTEGTKCSFCNEIGEERKVIVGDEKHVLVNGACINCGLSRTMSIQVVKESVANRTCYISVITNAGLTEIILPTIKVYNSSDNADYEIVKISKDAFRECAKLLSVTIPTNITMIEDGAFKDCVSLEKIAIEDGNVSFSNNEDLVLFNADKSIIKCFPRNSLASAQKAVKGVTEIGAYAFSSVTKLTTINLSGVNKIGEAGFNKCSLLESVVLKDGVSIENYAFNGCASLKTVYYTGSEKPTAFTEGNENLSNATWYFYSESAPTSAGNFWRYDASGNPVAW